MLLPIFLGFPSGSDGKESTCNAGDPGSIPGLGTSLGGEHGNPLQYVCLETPMDRGAWWAIVNRVAQSQILLKQKNLYSSCKIIKFSSI